MPHPTRVSGAGPSVTEPAAGGGDDGPKFVLTPYGWRTVEQAGGLTQEWNAVVVGWLVVDGGLVE